MTDEERRKLLVSQLRGRDADSAPANDFLCVDAADEIEWLAKELTELKATFRAAAIELGDPRTRQRQHPERQRKF